jgi:DNA-binding MarR family transcriptional regulator
LYEDLKKEFMEILHLPKKLREHFQKGSDLSFPEGMLLFQIAGMLRERPDREVCVSELRPVMGVSVAAISQAVSALEMKGFLARRIGAADRRSIALEITPKGQAALAERIRESNVFMDELITRFTPEKTRQMIDLFTEMTRIATEIRRSESAER